jgi:hypothetical protein
VEMLCTHAWKWKNETCWTIPRMGKEGIKKNDRGGEFHYEIL